MRLTALMKPKGEEPASTERDEKKESSLSFNLPPLLGRMTHVGGAVPWIAASITPLSCEYSETLANTSGPVVFVAPLHSNPGSVVHVTEHPSPLMVFPSSHDSSVSRNPSPHIPILEETLHEKDTKPASQTLQVPSE